MGSSTAARRTMIACCVALAAVAAPPSAAAPEPSLPAAQLPATLVEAIDRDLHITAQQYLARAGQVQRLADFETLARMAYPSVFAGVWMDGDRASVALTDGSSAADAWNAAERAGFRVATVANSRATLLARRETFEHWMSTRPPAADAVLSYGIDVAHNALAIRLAQDVQLPREAGPVRAVTAPAPTTGPGTDTTDAHPIADVAAGADFMGGLPYGLDWPGHSPRCTLGFNGTDADGHAVNITAGHCNPNNWFDTALKTPEPQQIYEMHGPERGDAMGYFAASQLGPHDFGIVRILDPYASRFQNNLIATNHVPLPAAPEPPLPNGSNGGAAGSSGTASPDQISVSPTDAGTLRIDGIADPIEGAEVCKSGIVTGFTCGTVIAVDQTHITKGVPGDEKRGIRIENMVDTDACSRQGDSGGPVVIGTKALGVTSSGGDDAKLPAPACGPHPVHVVQPLTVVQQENPGLAVRGADHRQPHG